MNKFRAVQDTDEYDTVYQCMSCFQTWAARYFGTNYCGHCGIKFEGQLDCRPHNIPRWQWDRWGDQGIPWSVELRRAEQQMSWPKPAPEPVWYIDSTFEAYVEQRGEDAWAIHRVLPAGKCTAYQAKRQLDYLRRDEEEARDSDEHEWPGRLLYRVRRGNAGDRLFHGVAR